MSVLTPIKEQKPKIHFKEYIRSEDTPTEEPKPDEKPETAEPKSDQ